MTTTTLESPKSSSQRGNAPNRAWHGAPIPTQVSVLTGRSLRALIRDPQLVIFSLLQPLIMLSLFSQVFGKAMMGTVASESGSYINYLMPAILVTTGIGAALQSGVGLITDMKSGVLGRFRSLPIRMWTVLVARSLADLLRTGIQLLILLIVGTALFGFSPAGGLPGMVSAFLLSLLVSWSLTWLFLAIAVWVRKEEVMQSVGFLAMFPLMFASSAFVPLDSLPQWLQAAATINPLTYAVDASRDLSLDLPVGNGVLSALVASSVLCVVGVVLSVRGFRRPM